MASCPDGRCDGSGFLFDEAARRARPCSCRPARLARKRASVLEGRIPKRYRGVDDLAGQHQRQAQDRDQEHDHQRHQHLQRPKLPDRAALRRLIDHVRGPHERSDIL